MSITDYLKKEGFVNKGLNADYWCCVFVICKDHLLFDLEDGTFELAYQPELYPDREIFFVNNHIAFFENDELSKLLSCVERIKLTNNKKDLKNGK